MKLSPVQQMIRLSQYREFPDTLEIVILCRAAAKFDKRSVRVALNGCARYRLRSVESPRLRKVLEQMATSFFPESFIKVIEDENHQMEKKLARKLATNGRTMEDMMNPDSWVIVTLDTATDMLKESGVEHHEAEREV